MTTPGRRTWSAVGLLALGLLGSGAGATSLEFGVAYRGGSLGLSSGLWPQAQVRLGVLDLPLGEGRLSAGVSNRAVQVGYSQGLSLPPLGAAQARSDLAVTWQGGLRLTSQASATAGPVALALTGAAFTTSVLNVDPLAAWGETAPDLREQGWAASLAARYRLDRTRVLVAGGELGAQAQGTLGLETRQDITRPVPPAEGDDPTLEPATERVGSLTWRVGARAGQGILGVTGGVSYATESGLTLGLDALVGQSGWGQGWTSGMSASLSAGEVLGEGSTLRLYADYEPWRMASVPLRAGADASLPLGSGTLQLGVRGGRDLSGNPGFGARVGYSFSLDAPAPDDAPAP